MNEQIQTRAGNIHIVPAAPEDLDAVLTVFDEALAGMVAEGNVKQWGITPFSQLPTLVERFRKHLEDDVVFVAMKEGRLVGVLVVNCAPPPYCWHGREEAAAYVQPFATVPSVRGAKIGHLLLEQAAQYALRQGVSRLRLDCFAENPKLPAYYEGAGFACQGEFAVGDWHGRMFEKILTPETVP